MCYKLQKIPIGIRQIHNEVDDVCNARRMRAEWD